MKKAIILQAQYNKFANQNMFAILQKASREILYKDCGLYYGSIMQTAEHSLCVSVVALKQYSTFATKSIDLERISTCINAENKLQNKIYEDINEFAKLQGQVDDKFIELIESVDDFDSPFTLSFPSIEFRKPRGFLILALLNHAIHHRGQIAGALDLLKIENDFSGMLGMQ